MRLHFISRLALLVLAGFLVVASQVWTGGTLEWLFVAGGVAMIGLCAPGLRRGAGSQRTIDGIIGVLGAWSIVQALVFSGANREWISFGTAMAAAGLAVVGLVIHEMTTERVVHELSVTAPGEEGRREDARRRGSMVS